MKPDEIRAKWLEALTRADSGASSLALLVEGLDLNGRFGSEVDDTLLMLAAGAGHALACRLLIDRGADVNLATKTHRTALHFAARKGHADVCRLLLDEGANVSAGANEGVETPLHSAVRSPAAVDVLLAAGAPINAFYPDHLTPLWLAVERADLGTFQKLLEAGADPLFRPENSWPEYLAPFEMAVYMGSATRARMMSMYSEIDPDIPTAAGISLFDLACQGASGASTGNEKGMLTLLRGLRAEYAVRSCLGQPACSDSAPFARPSFGPL